MALLIEVRGDLKFYDIHMPKTGGTRRGQLYRASFGVANVKNIGFNHDLPAPWNRNRLSICGVRYPPAWLRSLFFERTFSMFRQPAPSEGFWFHMCNRLGDHYVDYSFERFYKEVLDETPRFVSWVFSHYTPPGVKWFRMEETDEFLTENIPGIDVSKVGVINEARPTWEARFPTIRYPEIPDDLAVRHFERDPDAFLKYGYDPPGYIANF